MRIESIDPPRSFRAGNVELRDCARITLDADEQVTFVTDQGGEHDVTRKSWGFYATSSTNGRLAGFGLRAALLVNPEGRVFVVLVERGREDDFEAYRVAEGLEVTRWLDGSASG